MLTIDALKTETNIPVIIVDHNGTVVYINQIFEKKFGWQKDLLIGKTLTTLIPVHLKDAHHMGFSRFLLTAKPTILNQPLNLKILKMDGKEVDAEHIITAEKVNGSWVFGAKITPLKDTEKKL